MFTKASTGMKLGKKRIESIEEAPYLIYSKIEDNMDQKYESSIEELEYKRSSIRFSRASCEKQRDEIEYQGTKLRKFMDSVSDYSDVYGKDVSDHLDSEYSCIQKINKDIYRLDNDYIENVQREQRRINRLEEEISRDEAKRHQDR